jgi:predicted RNA polymerase sigma factor
MDTANGRRRFETSATAWTTRADMIQRLDESSNARRALARAEWVEGESPSIVAANGS